MSYYYLDNSYTTRVSQGLLIDINDFCQLIYNSCSNYLNHNSHYKTPAIKIVDDGDQQVNEKLSRYGALPADSTNGVTSWPYTKNYVLSEILKKISSFKTTHSNKIVYADATYDFITDCIHEVCRIYGQKFSYYKDVPESKIRTSSKKTFKNDESYGGEVNDYTWEMTTTFSISESAIIENLISVTLYGLGDYLITLDEFRVAFAQSTSSIIVNQLINAKGVCDFIDKLLVYCDTLISTVIDRGTRNSVSVSYSSNPLPWGHMTIWCDWSSGIIYRMHDEIASKYGYNEYTMKGRKNDDDDDTDAIGIGTKKSPYIVYS